MTAREEMETVYIYQSLTEAGYLLAQDGERWRITEPKSRDKPQQRLGLQTLREANAWADGCEMIRIAIANDEIERLRAERNDLLRTLKAIQTTPHHARADWPEIVDHMCTQARAAIDKVRKDF